MPISKEEIKKARSDFAGAFRERTVWMELGWNDVKTRYNRSKLGIFWACLSILIFVATIGPIYSSLFGLGVREYTLHLMLGLIVWNFVSGIIMDSGKEYIHGSSYLISFRLSYFTLLLRAVWRNLVVLGYQMLMFLLLAIVLQQPVYVAWLVVPFALALIALNALWIGILVSIFGTRFRDLPELLNNVMRLVFFITPIVWIPDPSMNLGWVATLNPFYHLIEIFRGSLLEGTIAVQSWQIVTGMIVVGWAISFPIFAKYRSRIAFWL